MSHNLVLDLAREALFTALMLAGPLLITALLVGVSISVLQAVTSVQEQTLSFVPKLFAIGTVLLILMAWMIQRAIQFTTEIFNMLPGMAP
ncbi:MAG: flagellar biosynthetic protein FliQ [Gemmatimonadales bacterium]|nr:MAG: flagellar biosynthetic protein FliQ [Gemmatimonadales bacterium]